MNYQKNYNSIIEKARLENRKKNAGIYYENHHIIPKCIGGSDDLKNKVLLTAKEHFICHKLLTYIYPNNNSLIYAFNRLSNDGRPDRKISSKDYKYRKELFNSMALSFSDEHKMKMSKTRKERNLAKGENNGMFGRKHSKESIEKMKLKKIGKKHTNEHNQKIGKAMKGKLAGEKHPYFGKTGPNKGKVFSSESKLKMKIAKEHMSNETKQKMSLSAKKTKQCEHCNKVCNIGNYNRWHGHNCKVLK